MSRYQFIDIDDNTYDVDDDTFKLLEESNPIESDILERSNKPGAINPGILRDTSKELVFDYETNYPTETAFRNYLNEFLYNARKCIKIKDTVLEVEIDVNYSDNSVGYDRGGFHKGAINTLTFTALTPFWEGIAYVTDTDSSITSATMTISNTGWIECSPIIKITALAQITKFSIRNVTTGRGILIEDLQFGTLGLEEYIIDCVNGTSQLNGISRENRIKAGTGYFTLPVGTSSVEFELSALANIELKYKRRYYV